MATITKRGDSQWQAKIRRKGYPPQSKTFNKKIDAENWALDTESDMQRGVFVDRREAETTTLHEVLEIYKRDVTPLKKGASKELPRLKKWLDSSLAKRSLAAVKGKDIAAFRDAERKRDMAENTIRLDIALLSAVYEHARKDLGIEIENPCRKIKLPGGSNKRERRISAAEEAALTDALPKAMPRTKHITELIKLTLETGMRQSEILGIEWSDVRLKEKIIHLDETKSGDPRDVPLSPAAIKIIESLPRPIGGGKAFQITQDRLIRGFTKACAIGRASIKEPPVDFLENLKFHDLRHEAASRWAAVLQAQELCKMFGWKTMQMALRYYHPTGTSIAEKLAHNSNR